MVETENHHRLSKRDLNDNRCFVFIELRNWLLQGFGAPWVGCMWIHPIYEFTSWLGSPGSSFGVSSIDSYSAHPLVNLEKNLFQIIGGTLDEFSYTHGCCVPGFSMQEHLPKVSTFPKLHTKKKQKIAIVNPSSTVRRPPHIRAKKVGSCTRFTPALPCG